MSEMIEGLASCRGAVRPKRFVRELEPPRLGVCNPVVVDNTVVPKPLDRVRQPGRFQSGKFRHRCDVDIKWIKKEAAVGKIRTCLVRPIIEQSMQRVEFDARCAEIGGEVDERDQIGKIAVAPIAGRSDPVQLHRKRPHPRGRGFTTLIGTIRTNDQACDVGQWTCRSRDSDMQAKDPMRQALREVEHGGNALAVGDLLLRPDLPPKRKAFRDAQVEGAIGLPAYHHGPRQHAGRLLATNCQGIKESRQDLRLYGLQLPERVAIFSLQAASGGTFQNIVHDRRALCGNRAVAVRRKQVTFSPQSADRQLGRYHLVPPPRSAPGRRVSRSSIPEAGGRAEPKRAPIGSTNTSPAVRVG